MDARYCKDEPEDAEEIDVDECDVCGMSLDECECDDADDEEDDGEFAPGAIGEYRY